MKIGRPTREKGWLDPEGRGGGEPIKVHGFDMNGSIGRSTKACA